MTRTRWLSCVVLALASACSDAEGPCGPGACPARDLVDSNYCPEGDCIRLEELSQGCIGSHTEQQCSLCGVVFTRVGGDDAATLYFEDSGALAAVRVTAEATGVCGGWYGTDLGGCVDFGEPRRVGCENAPE